MEPDVYYHYDPPGPKKLGDQPTVSDELAIEFVEVKYIDDFKDDGLFAIKEIPEGMLFVQYGGIRFNKLTPDYDKERYGKITGTPYLHTVGFCSGIMVDIREDMIDIKKYNATMGHKCNHKFQPNCIAIQVTEDAKTQAFTTVKHTFKIGIFLRDQFFCDKGKLLYNESSLLGQIAVICLRGLLRKLWIKTNTGSTISSGTHYFVDWESIYLSVTKYIQWTFFFWYIACKSTQLLFTNIN